MPRTSRRSRRLGWLVAAGLAVAGLSGCDAPDRPRGGPFAPTLPAFRLADPRGARHDRDALLADGGVLLVVTAPILASGDQQQAWAEELGKAAPSGGRFVMLEDLSQSSFPGTALARMRDEFDPGKQPLLLIDRDGALRTALRVADEATVVLIYDRRGALVHADAAAASRAGAQRAWAALGAAQ